MTEPVFERILGIIASNHVVLFMKGVTEAPQCGFSASVVQILSQHSIAFTSVNVLADPELREGIKQFSNWPTIPQLYVGGEFIGGADIVREMNQSGELALVLKGEDTAATLQ
ncbi:MAG: Grx4 family monothiol glutaredoxin [Acidiphilium sp.]|nr:Grx4 family monothiol glutaredoxin [Acidiphilium sp.]MDD4935125.1 Grx4 family monothiol glutaredoxin [Acidiphilium sp.]